MTTTSGYRFSQPQRVDSGLQQNVANTARLGANSPGSFGEAPRDRRTPHRTRKHLRSRLLAFYQLPELVFQLQCGSHTCRLHSFLDDRKNPLNCATACGVCPFQELIALVTLYYIT